MAGRRPALRIQAAFRFGSVFARMLGFLTSPMKNTFRFLAALLLVNLCSLIAATAAADATTLDQIKARGKLLVGSEMVFPTFNIKDPATGRNEGFMADVARDLAKQIFGDETKVEWIHTEDETRFKYIERGDVDVIIDTTPKSAEKEKVVAFSDELFRSGSALLVPKGSPIKTIDDIHVGTRVLYGKANPDVKFIRARAPGATYIEFEKSGAAVDALKAGKGDVFTQVVTHLYRAAHANPGSFVVTGRFTSKEYCIALKKGDPEFQKYLNEFIASLRSSGEYDRLFDKWFGPNGGQNVR